MSFATDPVYNNVLRFYFADTQVIGEEVWERFVTYVQPWMQVNPSLVEFLEMYIQKPGSIQTLSEVTSFPGGIYSTYLDKYFGHRPPADRVNIWRAFLAAEGFPKGGDLAPTPEELNTRELQDRFGNFVFSISNIEKQTVESLRSFAAQYNAYGFDRATLALDAVTSIPGGFYTDYLQAFFGARTAVEPFDIWRAFLVSIGYPKKDPTTGETVYQPSDDELAASAMKESFKRHVDAIRSHELAFAAATSETPHKIEMDLIFYGIMGSLSAMLTTTEQLIRNQAAALIAGGKIQQTYTNMMTRIPNLTSGTEGVMVVPAEAKLKSKEWSLSEEFLFGYNRINLQEVLDWGVESALAKPGTSLIYEQPVGCIYTFRLDTSGETPIMKIRFQYSGIDATEEFPLYKMNDATNVLEQLSRDECITATADAIKNIFGTDINAPKVATLTNKPGIPGRYLTAGGEGEDEKGEIAGLRAEQNTILQTYVENIRALRSVAKTQTQNLQALLTETKEKINLHTSLWTSILEMIDEIIHSIFQKS